MKDQQRKSVRHGILGVMIDKGEKGRSDVLISNIACSGCMGPGVENLAGQHACFAVNLLRQIDHQVQAYGDMLNFECSRQFGVAAAGRAVSNDRWRSCNLFNPCR
jgi:hypothetical protein